MIDNHNIYDFSTFDPSFGVFNHLGHRDKQVIRQCLQNFSVVIEMVRSNALPQILEIGAGLSTVLFSKLLKNPGEAIKTIDAFAFEAIKINSRGSSIHFNLSEFKNCEILEGTTINFRELQSFYSDPNSTIISLPHEKLLSNLDLFTSLELEDRNYHKVSTILQSSYLSSSDLKDYLIKNKLFVSELFNSYRTTSDEFIFLQKSQKPSILREVLKTFTPNVIYLDSGEFSSNIEFNILDQLIEAGTILIVQDIFFPKSIKSFLIASAIVASKSWQVLWVDRTTPQGLIICKKVESN